MVHFTFLFSAFILGALGIFVGAEIGAIICTMGGIILGLYLWHLSDMDDSEKTEKDQKMIF